MCLSMHSLRLHAIGGSLLHGVHLYKQVALELNLNTTGTWDKCFNLWKKLGTDAPKGTLIENFWNINGKVFMLTQLQVLTSLTQDIN